MVPGARRTGCRSRPARRRRGTGWSRDRLRRAAGAAVEEAVVVVLELLRGRRRVEDAGRRVPVEEVDPGRLHTQVVAVGVVVRGRLAEAAEEGEQVGGVGAQLGDVRLAVVERLDLRRDRVRRRPSGLRAGRRACRRGRWPARRGAGPCSGPRTPAPTCRRRCARETRNGFRSLVDSPVTSISGVEVVERRAQVDEGGVCLPQGGRQSHQRAVEGLVLGRDRAQRLVRVRGQRREVIAPLGDRAQAPRSRRRGTRRRSARRGSAPPAGGWSTGAPGRGTCRPRWPPSRCRCRRRPGPG